MSRRNGTGGGRRISTALHARIGSRVGKVVGIVIVLARRGSRIGMRTDTKMRVPTPGTSAAGAAIATVSVRRTTTEIANEIVTKTETGSARIATEPAHAHVPQPATTWPTASKPRAEADTHATSGLTVTLCPQPRQLPSHHHLTTRLASRSKARGPLPSKRRQRRRYPLRLRASRRLRARSEIEDLIVDAGRARSRSRM